MSSRKHSQSLPGMVAKIERQIMAMKGGARVCLSISLSSQGLPSLSAYSPFLPSPFFLSVTYEVQSDLLF